MEFLQNSFHIIRRLSNTKTNKILWLGTINILVSEYALAVLHSAFHVQDKELTEFIMYKIISHNTEYDVNVTIMYVYLL